MFTMNGKFQLRVRSSENHPHETLHAISFFLAVIVFKNNQIEVQILRQKKTQNAGNYTTFL